MKDYQKQSYSNKFQRKTAFWKKNEFRQNAQAPKNDKFVRHGMDYHKKTLLDPRFPTLVNTNQYQSDISHGFFADFDFELEVVTWLKLRQKLTEKTS